MWFGFVLDGCAGSVRVLLVFGLEFAFSGVVWVLMLLVWL